MHNAEIVHILQSVCNIDQLDDTLVSLLRGQVTTYELGAVHMPILPNELVDVPVFHPLGNHREPAATHCHSKQW